MQKIWLALTSRTFWTIVVMFVINGFAGIHDVIPPALVLPINTFLGLLATYFKVNPSQNYK